MKDLNSGKNNETRIVYKISQRNMLGARSLLLTQTRGTAVINTIFAGYYPQGPVAERSRSGVLVAFETGKALAYSLEAAQARGITFTNPNEEVYEGMIVGLSTKENDIDMNITRGKHLTNTRASNKDIRTVLTPAYKMSLEQALDFLEDDELLEVTPKNLRLRKKYLTRLARVRVARSGRKLQSN